MSDYISSLAIGKRIGFGHFGDVHLAVDPVRGEIAVKIISKKEHQKHDEWLLEKAEFLSEAQNLAKAEHPNIVPVYHLVESKDGSSIKYCMKLCNGGSLQSEYQDGPISLTKVRKIGTDVLLGLSALHARGMLHRDIKPGNILLDENGRACIGDFGLVTDRLVLGYASQAGYSDHIAYEVWHGEGTSIRSDIWAFGMTLYRLLHGEAWYKFSIAPKYSIAGGGFANSLNWLPHIPKRWRRFIRSMMVDEPAQRIQSVGAAEAALARLDIDLDWRCKVIENKVLWERTQGKRRIFVIWMRHSQRKHEWEAWSEPSNGIGIKRTLAGSMGIVGASKAKRGLEDYFAR